MSDFMDKMKDGFNKGVATVSTGSKNMVEKSKINTYIKTLENEKEQLAKILGDKVYNFCAENEAADIPRREVIGFCNEILKRNREIAAQRKQLEALEAEMNQVKGTNMTYTCSCGRSNPIEARFCAGCGNPLR